MIHHIIQTTEYMSPHCHHLPCRVIRTHLTSVCIQIIKIIKIIDSAQPPGDSRDLVTCFLSAMTVSSPGVVHVNRSRALSVQAGRQADGSDGGDGLSLAILA